MAVDMDKLKQIAAQMAREEGLINLSRSGLCKRAGIPEGSFRSVALCTFTDFIEEMRKLKIKTPLKTVLKARTNPELRREQILQVAVNLAKVHGYNQLTRDQIAESAGVSGGLIGQYYTMSTLKTAVMRYAVRCEVLEIVAQGLVMGNKRAKGAPQDLRRRAMEIHTK